jgi:hypothetical protein
MTTETPATQGPICPNCRASLRDSLRHERLVARDPSDGGPLRATVVTFCGACGFTLDVTTARRAFQDANNADHDEIVDPRNETSPGGQFQLRCRELVHEIEALGFAPHGWIDLVNRMGAAEAAKHLLAANRSLPVTHWLVDQGHAELTMEHEVADPRWNELFNDEARAAASRLLANAGRDSRPS